MDNSQQPGIRIIQVFLEEVSFRHAEGFLTHPAETPVHVDVDLSVDAGLSSDRSKGRVRVTVRTKPQDESLYIFNLTVTALLQQEGEGNFPLERYVTTNASAMMFPFVREAVANLTGRGRFGAVWLNPVNFVALAEAKRQDTALGEGGRAGESNSETPGADDPSVET